MTKVTNRIAEIRKAQQARLGSGFTQGALAARIGVTRAAVARWEAGAVPDALSAVRLARELGVTVEQLGFEEVGE